MAQGKSLDIGPIERLNERFAALAGWCFDQRALVAGVCLALLIGLGTYAFSGIETDASYEAYFYEGDNTYLAYEAYREDFGSDEVAYIGFELPGVEHGPWNVKAMGRWFRSPRLSRMKSRSSTT